jgi:quercetin dioxygenase-like cupin family protein
MIEPVRRVVIRHSSAGRSAIAIDGPSPHVHTLPDMSPDLGLTDLWYTGHDATSADAADRPLAVAPPDDGSLFRVVQFPPDTHGSEPFWHETATVDYNVLLSGALALLLEEGEVTLRAGDTVVVCGGRHAWSNRSRESARLATVSVSTVSVTEPGRAYPFVE